MPALEPIDQDRCYFHLGYGSGAGIPAGDLARLNEAMNDVKSNYIIIQVQVILDECDRIFSIAFSGKRDSSATRELIAGDINRSVTRTLDPTAARKSAWNDYLQITDVLAQQLWVANYWQPENLRYRFERSGGDFIKAVPGPADTAVGASQYEAGNLGNGGGFGLPIY